MYLRQNCTWMYLPDLEKLTFSIPFFAHLYTHQYTIFHNNLLKIHPKGRHIRPILIQYQCENQSPGLKSTHREKFSQVPEKNYRLVTHTDFHQANATFVRNLNMLLSLAIESSRVKDLLPSWRYNKRVRNMVRTPTLSVQFIRVNDPESIISFTLKCYKTYLGLHAF